jgi:hypothetical protein
MEPLTRMVFSHESCCSRICLACGLYTRNLWKPQSVPVPNGSGWQFTFACNDQCAPVARERDEETQEPEEMSR